MARRRQQKGTSITGPKLPFAVSQEIGSSSRSVGLHGSKRGTSMFHITQRKEARKAARKAKKMKGAAHLPGIVQESARPAKKIRMAPVELLHPAEGLETQLPVEQPAKQPKPVKTNFSKLLSADMLQGESQSAIDAEAELQQQLAKKLGLATKKRKRSEVKESGLREVLKDELLMSDSEEGSALGNADDNTSDSSDEISLSEGASVDRSEDKSGDEADGLDALADGQDSDLQSNLQEEEGSEEERNKDNPDASWPDNNAAAERQAGIASTTGRVPSQHPGSGGKYVPPAARQQGRTPEKEDAQLRRRVTGLINRLSDPNLSQIAGDLLALLAIESRQEVMDLVTELLLQAAADGPRATDRFAAVTAALVTGLAARANAAEVGARFAAGLAAKLEQAYAKGDSLSCGNLAGVFAQLYMCGLVPASCMYSFLSHLRTRFQEQDVALMHLLLRACGLKLRSEDPSAMKDLVVGVHARAAEEAGSMTQRTQVMLELVLDIKNNRRPKGSSTTAALEALLSQGTLRWLRESKVAEVQLQALTWDKLLLPNKKGMWWLPSAAEMDGLAPLAKESLATESEWGAELMQLAARLRMNTDVRRAVFCIIMGSDDYVDAAERLIRLPLKGEAQRDIVRVAFECCLQEANWNPYYAALVQNVLAASQTHCITAQFCIWDHLKELDSQETRRLTNLARLIASLITSKALPLSALRAADLGDVSSPQKQLFWRMVFERILSTPKDDTGALQLFKSLAQPHLQKFVAAVAAYLKGTFNADMLACSNTAQLLERSRLVLKALAGMRRVI